MASTKKNLTSFMPVNVIFILIFQLKFVYSLQYFNCTGTSTCQDRTLNFTGADAYVLTCDGYRACRNAIVLVSSSNNLSHDLTLNCTDYLSCEDTIIYSSRQTTLNCGSIGSNSGSSCKDMKIHVTGPPNSSNIIYSLGNDESLSTSKFFCNGDETASCGIRINGASKFNQLYCLGSVASQIYDYTFCLTNCSYESISDNTTNVSRCDVCIMNTISP